MMQKLKTVLSRPRVRAGVAATVAVAAVAAAAMVGVHVGRGEGREQAQAEMQQQFHDARNYAASFGISAAASREDVDKIRADRRENARMAGTVADPGDLPEALRAAAQAAAAKVASSPYGTRVNGIAWTSEPGCLTLWIPRFEGVLFAIPTDIPNGRVVGLGSTCKPAPAEAQAGTLAERWESAVQHANAFAYTDGGRIVLTLRRCDGFVAPVNGGEALDVVPPLSDSEFCKKGK